jgi:hypothetical protein
MPSLSHKPLAEFQVPKTEGTAGPPEPPTRPLEGPVWESKDGTFWCKVPGCSKPERDFEKRHSIAIHIARRHGLTMEGKPSAQAGGSRPPAPRDPEADLRNVNVRDVLSGNNLNLILQAIRILETTRENLTGKLSEMELLARKSAKLDHIIRQLRELVPAPAPLGSPAP